MILLNLEVNQGQCHGYGQNIRVIDMGEEIHRRKYRQNQCFHRDLDCMHLRKYCFNKLNG